MGNRSTRHRSFSVSRLPMTELHGITGPLIQGDELTLNEETPAIGVEPRSAVKDTPHARVFHKPRGFRWFGVVLAALLGCPPGAIMAGGVANTPLFGPLNSPLNSPQTLISAENSVQSADFAPLTASPSLRFFGSALSDASLSPSVLIARESIQHPAKTPDSSAKSSNATTEVIDLTQDELIDLTGGETTSAARSHSSPAFQATLVPTSSAPSKALGSSAVHSSSVVVVPVDAKAGVKSNGGAELIDLTSDSQAESVYMIDLTDGAEASVATHNAAIVPSTGAKQAEGTSAERASADTAAAANSVAMHTPATPAAPLPTSGVIVRVVDGDTYLLADGNRVRLSGVNTPEKSESIGMFVKEEIIRYLTNKEVTLTYGPTARDHYGRLVAEVWVDGQSMAEYLLRNGYAHLFIIPPSKPAHFDAMLQAQREARAAQRGIWAEERYRGPLHITSFHANARGNDRETPQGEYLRIANTTSGPLNLAGFSLTNLNGRTLQFPAVTIPEGYTFQVVSGNGAVTGSDLEAYKIYWNSNGPVWNNDDERATLIDPQGRWVDEALHQPKRTALKH